VSAVTWISDFASPFEFLDPLLRCSGYRPGDPEQNTNSGGYCDRRLDRLIVRAEAAEVSDPLRAQAIWARAERRAVDRAATAPAVTSKDIELVSRRTGHFTLDADSQLRFDQLWVR
jgi:peptide/nickel transport system substrate-binding protein